MLTPNVLALAAEIILAEAGNGIFGEIGRRMLPNSSTQECLHAGKGCIVLMVRFVTEAYGAYGTFTSGARR